MADETAADKADAESRSATRLRRKIYIQERLPAVLMEMKSLAEERRELIDKRKQAQPEERRHVNRRHHFVVERLSVLRAERTALIVERDGLAPQLAKGKEEK